MNNHRFLGQSSVCECGLSIWHEKHFDGSRLDAKAVFDLLRKAGGSVSTATRIFLDSDRTLAGFVAALTPDPIPEFASQEEADAWMEERNPMPQPKVPHFASQQEADEWLESQERYRGQSVYQQTWNPSSWTSTSGSYVMAPGNVNITW